MVNAQQPPQFTSGPQNPERNSVPQNGTLPWLQFFVPAGWCPEAPRNPYSGYPDYGQPSTTRMQSNPHPVGFQRQPSNAEAEKPASGKPETTQLAHQGATSSASGAPTLNSNRPQPSPESDPNRLSSELVVLGSGLNKSESKADLNCTTSATGKGQYTFTVTVLPDGSHKFTYMWDELPTH
jgi:hypothetical protein